MTRQAQATSASLFSGDESAGRHEGPVECLGMIFDSDEARRAYFLEKLREKLQDQEFRAIEGFPLGEDEDILRLSDPPYYTACPNPFIEDFIRCYGKPYDAATDDYRREPFATDVSEGKNDPIYNAHSYHTKVPHKAIMRYILHYTEPGDLVFDGFCGTGMTGVAAQMCGDRKTVSALGYRVSDDGLVADPGSGIISHLGARRAVLSDLSPIATFIAHNYNTPVDVDEFKRAAQHFFDEIESRLAWMYETKHTDGKRYRINYVVWSEVFHCQSCSGELVFLEEALDDESGVVSREFTCPNCGATISKRLMSRVFEGFYDQLSNATHKRVKRVPVIINYTVAGKKIEKKPDRDDLALLQRVESAPIMGFFPSSNVPYMHVTHIKDKMSNFGIERFSHFFLPRPQHALAVVWDVAQNCQDINVRRALLFMVEQCIPGMSVLNRYSPSHYSQSNRVMSGVYYIPSQVSEVSPWYILTGKCDRLRG